MNLKRFTSRVDGKKIRVITISATITGCPALCRMERLGFCKECIVKGKGQ
jgi:hypothetical protein